MNESIGGSGMFYIVIIIVSALLLLLMGFIAFSKAFKVKNHIINLIHEDSGEVDQSKIESDLISVGYSSNKIIDCDKTYTYNNLNYKKEQHNIGVTEEKDRDRLEITIPNDTKQTIYDYCVYKYTMADGSYYYTVLTYVHMNIPLIDDFIHIE